MRYIFFTLSLLLIIGCSKAVGKIDTTCINPSKVSHPRDCSYDYAPVCGCDESTYRNACFAKAAGVKEWSDGICPEMCIDPTIIIRDQICYRVSDPVCGCDGNTYINPCFARKQGILAFTPGECGASDVK